MRKKTAEMIVGSGGDMTTINISLNETEHLTKVKIEQENYLETFAWQIIMPDGQEGVITKDKSGIWVQRSKDNLCPPVIQKIGEAIEECLSFGNY